MTGAPTSLSPELFGGLYARGGVAAGALIDRALDAHRAERQ